MMFKMVGINIDDTIKRAKMEGKNMAEALAEALEPLQK